MSIVNAIRPETETETRARLAALVLRYRDDPDSWPLAPRFNPTARWYGLLDGDRGHEAWLLTWLPGQSTELHDHGGSVGAFAVVRGILIEEVPAAVKGRRNFVGLDSEALPAGAVRDFGAHHVHRLVNNSSSPAVSVHVYAPALTEMTRYRVEDGSLSVDTTTRAGVDW